MNMRALNRAWVRRWKNVRVGRLSASVIIITPSCLRVDRAMIFLRSFSTRAAKLAIRIVKEETINK